MVATFGSLRCTLTDTVIRRLPVASAKANDRDTDRLLAVSWRR
ncbi:hypothetical protein [Sphaerisporangium flaviroseum]